MKDYWFRLWDILWMIPVFVFGIVKTGLDTDSTQSGITGKTFGATTLSGPTRIGNTTQDIYMDRVAGTNGGRVSFYASGATASSQMELAPGVSVNPAGTITSEYVLFNKIGADAEYCALAWFGNELSLSTTANGGGSVRQISLQIGANIMVQLVPSTTTLKLGDNGGAGEIQIMKALVALGGGATATLGTIGGSGPTAAAQNTWMRFKDSTGATCWIPVWK